VIYSELYRVLWRRKLLILLGTFVCILFALVVTSSQQKLYTATATVRVVPSSTSNANDSFEASQRLSRSYAEIYTQGAVAPRMSQLIGARSPVKLSELAAGQVKDLDLLAVSGVSEDPRRAVLIANAGARALEDFSTRERLSLITPARLPTSPSSPNVPLNLVLALLAGFILSAGLALALNAILQPIAGPEDLERELEVPVLAVVPKLRLMSKRPQGVLGRDDGPPELTYADEPGAPGATRAASRGARGGRS
jgi:capsular polysaccharide biosynthesis protein